jgi:peptide/nickel transport system ATP-binding protein
MRQRAMIAMALACDPQLLIADEPTTALDVTIQPQILELLRDLQAQTGMAILLITHDLGVAAQMADRVAVIYAGRIVEDAPAARIFDRPAHPYTSALLQSAVDGRLPRGTRLAAIPGSIPSPAAPPSGCRFHPRCPRADRRCGTEAPLPRGLGAATVACWHPHEEPLQTVPALAAPPIAAVTSRPVLLTAVDVRKDFARGVPWFGQRTVTHAVNGVSLEIAQGEAFGLVGESGCGKSTLARLMLRLDRPTGGRVLFDGTDLADLHGSALRRLRRDMQMVFQDPYGSIDPRCTVGDIVGEPLRAHLRLDAPQRRARVRALLEQVGLDPRWEARYPHQLSGGQRQRVAIARAIALNPRFVLWDEAVSALDVSVQAQVINLLQDLKAQLGLTYLFIGHGLHLVRHVSDRIGVMYLGRLVEVGPADTLFHAPAHPYTRALIDAIPTSDPARRRWAAALPGEMPSADRQPTGCRFHTRCAAATEYCRQKEPPLAPLGADRNVACHFPL